MEKNLIDEMKLWHAWFITSILIIPIAFATGIFFGRVVMICNL